MDILPILRKAHVIVVSSHMAAREEIAALSAELALRGPVTVWMVATVSRSTALHA